MLYAAHRLVEQLTLDRDLTHLRDRLAPEVAEMVYYGFWYAAKMDALMAFIREAQKHVTGEVTLEPLQRQHHGRQPHQPQQPVRRRHRQHGRGRHLQPNRRRRLPAHPGPADPRASQVAGAEVSISDCMAEIVWNHPAGPAIAALLAAAVAAAGYLILHRATGGAAQASRLLERGVRLFMGANTTRPSRSSWKSRGSYRLIPDCSLLDRPLPSGSRPARGSDRSLRSLAQARSHEGPGLLRPGSFASRTGTLRPRGGGLFHGRG